MEGFFPRHRNRAPAWRYAKKQRVETLRLILRRAGTGPETSAPAPIDSLTSYTTMMRPFQQSAEQTLAGAARVLEWGRRALARVAASACASRTVGIAQRWAKACWLMFLICCWSSCRTYRRAGMGWRLQQELDQLAAQGRDRDVWPGPPQAVSAPSYGVASRAATLRSSSSRVNGFRTATEHACMTPFTRTTSVTPDR